MKNVWVVVALAALMAACGDSDGGGDDAPLPLRMENLEGYWAGLPLVSTETGSASVSFEPYVLHFRPGSEAEGVEWVADIGNPSPLLGWASLEDGTLSVGADLTNSGVRHEWTVEEVTANRVVLRGAMGGTDVTLSRQPGCSALGGYVQAIGRVRDAGFGPDGALHIIGNGDQFLNEDLSANHYFRPAGQCAMVSTGYGGEALDVAPDGNVRFVRKDHGSGVLTFLELAWTDGRWTVAREEVVSPGYGGTYELGHRPDGSPLVFAAAGGEVSVFERTATEWTQTVLPTRGGGSLNPLVIDVQYDPDGFPIVRPDRVTEAARWDGSGWVAWEIPRPEDVNGVAGFGWLPDGRQVVTYRGDSTNNVGVIALAVEGADGTWEEYAVGLGQPWTMGIDDEGIVTIAANHDPENTRVMSAIEVDLDAPEAAVQRLVRAQTNNQSTTQYDSIWKWFPVAAFGPAGASYMGNQSGGYREPASEDGVEAHEMRLAIVFAEGAEALVEIPSLGIECTSDCEAMVPWNSIVSVRVTSEAGKVVCAGGSDRYINAGVTSCSREDLMHVVAWNPYSDPTLAFEGQLVIEVEDHRIMTSIPIPEEGLAETEAGRPFGLDAFPNGDLLVRAGGGQSLVFERRDWATGERLASYSECPLALVANPTPAGVFEDGAAVVTSAYEDCGPFTAFQDRIVWFDADLNITRTEEFTRPELYGFTTEGTMVLFELGYDGMGTEWVDVIAIAPDGARTENELESLRPGDAAWPIPGGVVTRKPWTGAPGYDDVGDDVVAPNEVGYAAFNTDGSARWLRSIPERMTVMAARTIGTDFILAIATDGQSGVSIDGHSPDRPELNADYPRTWLLGFDVETGAVTVDVAIPYSVNAMGDFARVADGVWGLFDHLEGRPVAALGRDGELIELRDFRTGTPPNCWGGGCPARRVFAVGSGVGAWLLRPDPPGSSLTFWDPSSALD